jgi:transposase-like protein
MEKLKETTKIRPNASTSYSATEKCQAVLSVWTEKRKPSAVCQELGIKWAILQLWQNRAMEGMLQALESRRNLAQGAALSPRLQALLMHREKSLAQNVPSSDRLTSRLSARLAAAAAKGEAKQSESSKHQSKE